MSYVLYYSPGAASMAVHWMLIELGVPFETRLVDIDAGALDTQHAAPGNDMAASCEVHTAPSRDADVCRVECA
ncbi:hypothetical protein [Burkholderia cepacia]|uniref:hypothetical protein n=1 Tax=Burkholderia cepacia TaxID=292 RepID=UPI0021AB6E79|nr:hypothetical protein [Burkholderia cepacia]